jgi:DNA-binding XRE family transcriptional regulator
MTNTLSPKREADALMTVRYPFDRLPDGMTPKPRADHARKAAGLREDMTLAELRQARDLTQGTLGAALQVGQTAIAKMEKRADMYVSNLRRVVQALGGELDLVARFPDGVVKISNFADASRRTDQA